MTSRHTKAIALQVTGLVAMLLALLDDSYLHMPFPVFVAVVISGIVCLLVSYRLRRATQSRPQSITLRQKHQRFAILVAAALFGCILVSFLPASGTSHLSPKIRMLSSVGAMAFAIAILAWKIYFSRRSTRNGPNQSLQPTAGRFDE